MHFKTIVIGKGLIGSAAAKYLSANENNIAIIGPNEPEDYSKAMVFASHYDQARVQRIIGKDETWTKLNQQSTLAYKNLETLSGINFHNGVGCMYVQPAGADAYLQHADRIAKAYHLSYTYFNNGHQINNQFTDYYFPPTAHGLYEANPAGFINPRLLIQAQLNIFEQQKGTIINDTIIEITKAKNLFEVKTNVKVFTTDKVLLATGSFINYLNLLPQKLALKTKSETILLAQVSKQTAIDLANLPSLLYEIETPELDGIYLIQPVQYEDGNYYLKMGCNVPEDIYFNTLEEAQNWFKNGDSSKLADRLLQALNLILPNVKIENYYTRNCIISRTVHGRPYIGETNLPGLFVAGGCNGYSAMCSNEIGNIAAHLIQQCKLPKSYNSTEFEVVYEEK